MPEKCVEIVYKSTVTKRLFSSQCPEEFRLLMVGINPHLQQSIAQGTLDLSQLWINDYLEYRPTETKDDGARVTAYFRIARSTETIDKQFIEANMHRYQLSSGGWATHLIQQVVYGAEFIVSMRMGDLKNETKKSAEDKIYQAATAYFEKTIKTNWVEIEPLEAGLDSVACTVFSNLNSRQEQKTSFKQAVEWLKNAVQLNEVGGVKWKPIEIVLSLIPSQLETRLHMEKIKVNQLEMELNLRWISTKSRALSKDSLLRRTPFKTLLCQFLVLIVPFRNKIGELHAAHTVNSTIPERVFQDQKEIKDLLSNAIAWLLRLGNEVESLHPHLNSAQLIMSDLSEIEARPSSAIEKRAQVFILHVDYKQDPLLEKFHKYVYNSSLMDFKRPVFPILSAGKKQLEAIAAELARFAEDARLCANANNTYVIGLVPLSSPLADGTIKIVSCPALPEKSIPSLPPPLIPIFPMNPKIRVIKDDQLLASSIEFGPEDTQLKHLGESSSPIDSPSAFSSTSSDIQILHESLGKRAKF